MAVRGSGKKSESEKKAGSRAKAQARPTAPVLGNDPFERGAAVRTSSTSNPTSAPNPTPAPAPTTNPTSGVAATAAALRQRLESIEERVESVAERAAARLGEVARDEVSRRAPQELRQALASLVPALREGLHALGALGAVFAAAGTADAHGLDRELWKRVEPALDFLYATWWRVATREIANVPTAGPVVLVANHGGTLPWDAVVLRLALEREHPARRDLRPLLDQHALALPLAGGALARLGAVPANPENAQRVLAAGLAVAVFPEGSRGVRPSSQRYRLDRFGRGGFVKVALRAGAPIVPCAIVGSEETSAPFARPGWLAEWLGLPFLGAASPLPLAPLGLLPLPSRWSIRFGPPIAADAGPAAADDAAVVLELAERTREALQAMLDEDVAARRSVYL